MKKHLRDRKSWTVALVESFGIFLFNAAFMEDFYSALGDKVQNKNVLLISGGLFIARVLWFYGNLRWRIFWEKGGS